MKRPKKKMKVKMKKKNDENKKEEKENKNQNKNTIKSLYDESNLNLKENAYLLNKLI